jgi:hypothetical protein
LVSTAIAHEPPLAELLDDRDDQRAIRADIMETFRGGDETGAIRKFFTVSEIPMPEDMFQRMFGNRGPAEIANDRFFYLHELEPTSSWRPDLDALRAIDTHLIIGIGETSEGMLCDRASRALAIELKLDPTLFPGGHGGFMENPVAFAARLRELIG